MVRSPERRRGRAAPARTLAKVRRRLKISSEGDDAAYSRTLSPRERVAAQRPGEGRPERKAPSLPHPAARGSTLSRREKVEEPPSITLRTAIDPPMVTRYTS